MAGDSETGVLIDSSNVIVESVTFSEVGLWSPSLDLSILRRLEDLSVGNIIRTQFIMPSIKDESMHDYSYVCDG